MKRQKNTATVPPNPPSQGQVVFALVLCRGLLSLARPTIYIDQQPAINNSLCYNTMRERAAASKKSLTTASTTSSLRASYYNTTRSLARPLVRRELSRMEDGREKGRENKGEGRRRGRFFLLNGGAAARVLWSSLSHSKLNSGAGSHLRAARHCCCCCKAAATAAEPWSRGGVGCTASRRGLVVLTGKYHSPEPPQLLAWEAAGEPLPEISLGMVSEVMGPTAGQPPHLFPSLRQRPGHRD